VSATLIGSSALPGARANAAFNLLGGGIADTMKKAQVPLRAVRSRFTRTTILSIGFLIASIVPTARFAQPIGAAILYPMIGLCGLFVPVQSMPPALQVVARVLPLTYAVSLLEGIRKGEAWSTHMGDVAALVVVFAICTALSTKVFRWE